MQTAAKAAAGSGAAGKVRPPFKRLWSNARRERQLKRFKKLQRQACDAAGEACKAQIVERLAQVPKAFTRGLVVPSGRVFGAVVGVFRTGATLHKDPIWQTELSAAELAALARYGRSTVEAALRLLGGEPIHVKGTWVADGLGILTREKRFGKAMFGDRVKPASKTSAICISLIGRIALSLDGNQNDDRQLTECERVKRGQKKSRRERRADMFLQTQTRKPTHITHTHGVTKADDRDEPVHQIIDLRPFVDGIDQRPKVVSQLDFTLKYATRCLVRARNFIFPSAQELDHFNAAQQAKFAQLTEAMPQDEQALVPEHLKRMKQQ